MNDITFSSFAPFSASPSASAQKEAARSSTLITRKKKIKTKTQLVRKAQIIYMKLRTPKKQRKNAGIMNVIR